MTALLQNKNNFDTCNKKNDGPFIQNSLVNGKTLPMHNRFISPIMINADEYWNIEK